MAQPTTDETTETRIAVMVERADHATFDKLSTDRTWPHWRMFREVLGTYIAHQELKADTKPKTT